MSFTATQEAVSDEDVREVEQDTPSANDEQLNDIEKQVAHRVWEFAGDFEIRNQRTGNVETRRFEATYSQRPLSYVQMLEFTGLIGNKIEQIMSGPTGLTIDGIFGNDGIFSSIAEFGDIGDSMRLDAFIMGFAKLAGYVPELVIEAQCIWLRIPIRDRQIVQEIWARPVDEGGLSMDDGEEMMDLFFDQNGEELLGFFNKRLPRILARVRKLRSKSTKSSPDADPQQ